MEDTAVTSPGVVLKNQLRVLRRRKWTIIICVVVTVGLSGVYDYLKTPEYVASAQVQLTPQISTSLLEASNSSLLNSANPVDVPTDSKVIESSSVADRVKQTIPNAPPVTVTELGITDVVSLSVSSTDPELAAKAANAYAAAYIKIQTFESVAALDSATTIIQTHINQNQDTINSLTSQIQNTNSSNSDLQSLITQLTAIEGSQATLRQQVSQYATAAALATGGGQVISAATVPTKPSAPKPVEYGILALLVGLAVGIGLAFLFERLDEKIRSADDLNPLIGDAPIIGLVPSVGEWRDRTTPYVVTMQSPASPVSEAYRSLRTSIRFLALERDFHKILLTSPIAAEGKTSTVSNLAVAMAQAGQRVVVVDCDLRRPRIHQFFGLPNEVGFTSVLLGEVALESVMQDVPGQPNLKILPSGLVPPNPSELLSGRRAHDVLDLLAGYADAVLIDTPPIVPVTDAAVLSARVDAVVLVTAAGVSTRPDLSRALATLRRVEAPLAGIVLNRAVEDDSYSYYNYSYSSAYASRPTGGHEGNGKRVPAHAGSAVPASEAEMVEETTSSGG